MNATSLLMEYPALSETEMVGLAEEFARILKNGDVIGLSGELGTGKTTLARAVIHALSDAPVDVTSPTFTLMQEYPVMLGDGQKGKILHCDLYRLESAAEVHSIGLLEMLDDHITLIEWPQIIESLLPPGALHITCAIGSDNNTRRLSFDGVGDWKSRLTSLHP